MEAWGDCSSRGVWSAVSKGQARRSWKSVPWSASSLSSFLAWGLHLFADFPIYLPRDNRTWDPRGLPGAFLGWDLGSGGTGALCPWNRKDDVSDSHRRDSWKVQSHTEGAGVHQCGIAEAGNESTPERRSVWTPHSLAFSQSSTSFTNQEGKLLRG